MSDGISDELQDQLDKEFMRHLDALDSNLAGWARHLWDGGMPMDDIVRTLQRATRIAEVTRRLPAQGEGA